MAEGGCSSSCSTISNCQSQIALDSQDEDCTTLDAFFTRTILNSLRCPTQSVSARRRRNRSNPPPVDSKRCTTNAKAVYEPKSVSASAGVKEFLNEQLTVTNGVLFCSACSFQNRSSRSATFCSQVL